MSTDTIQITLPDGATREVRRGTTAAEIARQISPRLAKEALVARAEGELVDLSRPLEHDAKISILTAKDPDSLQVFRHSAAHLLAAAVLELYPDVKLGIGPPIDTGFFYEFVRKEPFTQDDLEKIEAKMHELAAKDFPNERKLIPKPEALELYRKSNQEFKCEGGEKKSSRADGFLLHHRKIHRFLPRPAHSFHCAHQGFQIDERRGRVLERQGKQSADAADLRRMFHRSKRTRRIFAQARRSQAPRPSPHRKRTRPFHRERPGGSRLAALAAERRHHSPPFGGLHPGKGTSRRLPACLHSRPREG